jgi:hypothetical protein
MRRPGQAEPHTDIRIGELQLDELELVSMFICMVSSNSIPIAN